MIWGKTNKEKEDWQKKKDSHWFVWYPIQLVDGRWVWWEFVIRESWCSWDGSYYEYKMKGIV